VAIEIEIQILKKMLPTTLSRKITISTQEEINTEQGILTKGRCSVTTMTSLVITLMSVGKTTLQTRKVGRMMKYTWCKMMNVLI